MSCRQWAGYLEAGGAHGDGGVGEERAEVLPLQGAGPALDEDVPTAHGAQHRTARHHRHELRAALLHGRWAGKKHRAPVPSLSHGDTFMWVTIPEFGGVAREDPRGFLCQAM